MNKKSNLNNNYNIQNNYNPISVNLKSQLSKENLSNKFSSIENMNSNQNKQNLKHDSIHSEEKNIPQIFNLSNSFDGLNNNNNKNKTNNNNYLKVSKSTLKHDGFSINNIPRVDTLYTMSDPKFLNFSHTNFHCKKIIKSLHLSHNLKVKEEIPKISKVEVRKVNKAKNPKDFVEKLCDLENTKYVRIFNMQRSSEFLEERQLPEIKYEKKNIDFGKNFYNNGNSKFMGVNYNPFNYDLVASKNRTKRNVFGTLFIN